jgi:hypothetical protein
MDLSGTHLNHIKTAEIKRREVCPLPRVEGGCAGSALGPSSETSRRVVSLVIQSPTGRSEGRLTHWPSTENGGSYLDFDSPPSTPNPEWHRANRVGCNGYHPKAREPTQLKLAVIPYRICVI